MTNNCITIKGASVNNLKKIDVEIPRNKFIVITGLSGSGKSSLAFDTLYAEGQRRYVESLSAYARQFLGKLQKPECDYIKGLPPAIAIEQKVSTRNPRSTVGTSTEIYDYLRLLFARIGQTISPISGNIVKKHSVADVIDCLKSYPEGTKAAILSKITVLENRSFSEQLDILIKEGFSRVEANGAFYEIDEIINNGDYNNDNCHLLIDRIAISYDNDSISRATDSIETAFKEGNGFCVLKIWSEEGVKEVTFSNRFEEDGMSFNEPNEQMFNFNNPIGACPTCDGFGKVLGIDEDLVIPNKALSVFDDAVMCWRGEVSSEWKRNFINAAVPMGFPIHRPYYQLTEEERNLLWHGSEGVNGIDSFFQMVEKNLYKVQYSTMRARYRGKSRCPECDGKRLKKEALYVKINGKDISEIVTMPISELKVWFSELVLSDTEKQIAKRLLTEINNRIEYLTEVGLEYLTLDRLSSTLSGGESQRINLATILGSGLVGTVYILDEPSIGLHARDTEKLIGVLRKLQQKGNTVVVVEHEEEVIKAADYIIDVGPEAGRLGGKIVYQGDVANLQKASDSYTVKYLTGELQIPVPSPRHRWRNYIEVKGAAENNLKGIDVKFPLGIMTVVTGVSGSGKSTLVRDILYKSLLRALGLGGDTPGTHLELTGDISLIHSVEFVDQNPIGKSTHSNAATYLKAFDEIRKLFADQQASKQMGYSPSHFAFNVDGGRCEECKGEGKITIEMQFMADITIPCESCHGMRYKQEILDIRYRGKNIYDILNMTVNQAIEFFSEGNSTYDAKIIKRLKPLQDVGLGYLKLGQSSSTLSGGENQRIKLANYLASAKQTPSIFIFDEPTTGLHIHDINTLLKAFGKLISAGHTIIIIEHNMDIIKNADYVIDLGPEGGKNGGYLVATGTPEEIAQCENSYTGKFLKDKLQI